VLVIGAGPVGLVLANELQRFDVSYRLVEKLTERSTWSKALMITSRTMLILEDIGLHEEILSRGTVVEGMHGLFNQREIGSMTMDIVRDPNVRYPFPFVLGQPDIEESFEHVLNKRGGRIERGCEAVKINVLKDHVEVTLKSGEVIKAKYVVGCDGAHSIVRHSQPWTFEGRPVNILWAQCDGTIKNQAVHTTRAAFFLGKTGPYKLTHPTDL
jgi:2-polyprenyl-6-methoxyphenol hydroxylase-like FAD-dependent oxidoreductase